MRGLRNAQQIFSMKDFDFYNHQLAGEMGRQSTPLVKPTVEKNVTISLFLLSRERC